MDNPEHPEKKEKIYLGSIVIFFRKVDGETKFLLAENTQTGNVSFISGAKEDIDSDLEKTARREIREELGFEAEDLKLVATDIRHEFVFGPNKKERAGQTGSYQVFLADLSGTEFPISHTEELKSVKWLNADEVMQKLTFPDVKEVFRKVLAKME